MKEEERKSNKKYLLNRFYKQNNTAVLADTVAEMN